ncbi:hypothetical protein SDC9_06495 [bioreactor metagenome]|uniref:Uncharacterized protein n=1 Tax=bioreactor metagenome TaxID=1076179 RepID=A0A644T1Z8_9ZZZZ
MHHRDRLPPGEDFVEPRAVGKLALFERTELHRVAPAGDEAVIGDGHIARRPQRLAGVRADVAGAAGDQNVLCHRRLLGRLLHRHDVGQEARELVAQVGAR